MRFLQAGEQQLVALDPDHEVISNLVDQAGFACESDETPRLLTLEVRPSEPTESLLLFDAADPANLGWFSRCQFYVDAFTGRVLQTPLTLANCYDGKRLQLDRVRLGLEKELPAGFRLPGRQTVSEQVVYALLFNLLQALRETGVALCGTGGVKSLSGSSRGSARK